ncbi:PocR ligand-binding domain-containing protein [Thermovirga sp.]|uniref:sensor histidine kinase n=1 Tax=Thermovirga sp. TaxID=2699834 RepID=UPI0025E485BD|nr:PocR ligand-binding domain-containing protein [Thermovirga sp.]MBO8154524.1 PocR ligand-binding domain-containing protein [Thermovirga sp.]
MDGAGMYREGTLEWWKYVVDVDALEGIVENFAVSNNYAAILTTPEGTPVTKPCNFSNFCKIIRSIDGGERCRKSDAEGGRKAITSGDVKIYTCHAGLIDMAVPIMLSEDKTVGILLMGQVKLREYTRKEVQELADRFWHFDYKERERLIESFLKIPVVDEEQLRRSAMLLKLVASHIVTICEKHLSERKFLEKGITIMKRKVNKEALERNLKQAQVRSLQNKLNPHFIFNTLNVISRLAMFEGAKQTQELTIKFAEYLRYVLGKQKRGNFVMLKDELDCAKCFLDIYKSRFGERLSFEIDAEPETLNVFVPFMLLQPVVENAVVHGVEPSVRPACVAIKSCIKGDYLYLTVKDDGVGCDTEKLKKGLGLSNLEEKVRLYFREKANIAFKSSPNEGTEVQIVIPIVREGER